MPKYFHTAEAAIEASELAFKGDFSLMELAPITKLFQEYKVVHDVISGATDNHSYTVYKGKWNIIKTIS